MKRQDLPNMDLAQYQLQSIPLKRLVSLGLTLPQAPKQHAQILVQLVHNTTNTASEYNEFIEHQVY